MRAASLEACGCFPTGRHYPGIAHLLRAVTRGLVEELAADAAWAELPIALIDVETTGTRRLGRPRRRGRHRHRPRRRDRRAQELAREPGPAHPQGSERRPQDHRRRREGRAALRRGRRGDRGGARGCVPAAYNAAFDRAFLGNEVARASDERRARCAPALRSNVDWVDPLVWARELQQGERSRALGEVAARLGIALENAHRASDDAEAASRDARARPGRARPADVRGARPGAAASRDGAGRRTPAEQMALSASAPDCALR